MSGEKDEHRRTSKEAHDNSSDGASGPDQGTGRETNSWLTVTNGPHSQQAYNGPGAGAGLNALNQHLAKAQLAQQNAIQQMNLAQWAAQHTAALYKQSISGYANYRSRYCPPLHIEDAGISVGEIIGWRAWMIDPYWPDCPDPRMESVSAMKKWTPGEPMTGEPDRPWEGVHSFKTKELLEANLSKHQFVLGTIKMWGRVIEHEAGYRAEFARVHSIYSMPTEQKSIFGRSLRRLRRMYGVPP